MNMLRKQAPSSFTSKPRRQLKISSCLYHLSCENMKKRMTYNDKRSLSTNRVLRSCGSAYLNEILGVRSAAGGVDALERTEVAVVAQSAALLHSPRSSLPRSLPRQTMETTTSKLTSSHHPSTPLSQRITTLSGRSKTGYEGRLGVLGRRRRRSARAEVRLNIKEPTSTNNNTPRILAFSPLSSPSPPLQAYTVHSEKSHS